MTGAGSVYLDHNATTPPFPEVVDAVMHCLRDGWGNPSSAHSFGSRAVRELEKARDAVARLIKADPARIVFTSGATESCNRALDSVGVGGRAHHLGITSIEHDAVWKKAEDLERRGCRLSEIAVDAQGVVVLESVEAALVAGASLISIQWANGELGTIQPIQSVCSTAARFGAMVHIDASQAAGRIPIDVDAVRADFVSISGHKIGAPPGIGALWVRNDRTLRTGFLGGDQEHRRRAGTQNLIGAVGFGVAAQVREQKQDAIAAEQGRIRDQLEEALTRFGNVNSRSAPRVPNTTSLTMPGIDAAGVVARLNALGVCVSQGSACHSARPEPSRVLRAIGLDEESALATIRISTGWTTTSDDVHTLISQLARVLDRSPVGT